MRALKVSLPGLLMALAASASWALDLDREVAFSIPAQPLDAALIEFSKQAQLQVVTTGDAVRSLRSGGVVGAFRVGDALDRLLGASGLSFKAIGDSAISIGAFDRALRLSAAASPVQTHTDVLRSAQPARDAQERAAAKEVVLQEVVVTGTNIAGVAPAGSPVLTLDAEAIRQSGYSSTEQLLQALPQNFRGGQAGASADVNMSTGSLSRLNGTAGSGVNLRGLGSASTLILINGRRVAASAAGTFTDISMIPIDSIERIEILTDGASAIYGADAVAGVVNVILKQNFDGAETRVRYGFTTESGREEYRVSQSYGTQWSGGGVSFAAEYLDQGQLLATERRATANVISPNSIFPQNELASLILTGRQEISERWSASSDIQYSRSDRHLISTSGSGRSDNLIEPERANAAVSVGYAAFGDWTFALDGGLSEEDTETRLTSRNRVTGAKNFSYIQTQTQDQWSADLHGSGSLFALPAGAVKLALGASYRTEEYYRHIDLYNFVHEADRNVASAFVEFHVPLVSAANALPGVRSLQLSLAGRYDDYSDFGSSTNPKIGVSWSPFADLVVRSSYSTSFRAPATGRELIESDRGVQAVDVQPFFARDGVNFVPVALLFGSDRLEPEESTNWTFGFTFTPRFASDLSIALTYYDISYTDRIIVPPLDYGALSNPELQAFLQYFDTPAELIAVVDGYLSRGAFFSDFTDGMFGDDPLSQTTAIYSYLWTNAERVDVSGVDLNIEQAFTRGKNHFGVALNANYIEKMVNVPAPGALAYDLVDTFGNPPNLRARASASWSRGGFRSALIVNYTDAYTDTSGLIDRRTDAYTTVDATLRHTLDAVGGMLDGLSLSLAVTNLFDESPPYVEAAGSGANYDPANASPLGRMIAVEVAKRW